MPQGSNQDEFISASAMLERLRDDPGTLKLSSGIVLSISAAPQALVQRAAARIPRPEPPMVNDEEKGREEENPLDPDYLAEVAAWENKQYAAAAETAMLLGTQCISVPDGMHRPEDDGWLNYLSVLGMGNEADISTPEARYYSWLRLYALRTNLDTQLASYGPLLLSGVSEEEVSLAIAAFRSSKERRPDPVGADAGDDQDGDRVPAAAPGDGADHRGAGSRAVRRRAARDVSRNGAGGSR